MDIWVSSSLGLLRIKLLGHTYDKNWLGETFHVHGFRRATIVKMLKFPQNWSIDSKQSL